jgi:hypothetical protein
VRAIRYLMILVLLACCGCQEAHTIRPPPDRRLEYVSSNELQAATRAGECIVLLGRQKIRTNIFVDDGMRFSGILSLFDSSFTHDSLAVVISDHKVQRLPGWYEVGRLKERKEFLNETIKPGDIVFFPPIQ